MAESSWNAGRWQRVSETFADVITLPPAARAEFIDRLRATDAVLAREIARMLAADEAFDTQTPPSPGELLSDVLDPVLPAGARLGAYAIERSLGHGGMGRVYLAQRVDGGVAQTVAIKLLRFRSRDADFMRRFLRERRLLARLSHASIARFLDTGTSDDGQPFIVMEYVDGEPITTFARSNRLSLRARIALLLKVMDAVAYSHRQLVLHLDIKPANVMVDRNGEPHLLDFGIAKALADSENDSADATQTRPGQRAFSISYAAPEQLLECDVAMASDVYSLAVLTYELLCDELPLALAGLAPGDARRDVLDRYPVRPSERVQHAGCAPDGSSAASWSRALRGDLDRILLHALRKEASARYATVDAFAADLAAWLACQPISLRSGQRLYQWRRFVARHRMAVTLAGVAVLTACAAAALQLHQAQLTRVERDAAIAQGRRAEAMNVLLLESFEAADPSRNKGELPTVTDVLDRAARRVASSQVDATTRIALLTSVADVYRSLGRHGESLAAAEQAVAEATDRADVVHARAWRALARTQLVLGELDDSEASLARADLPQVGSQNLRTVEAIEQERVRINVLLARGALPRALDRLSILYRRAERELGTDNAQTMRIGLSLAQQLRILRRPDEGAALVAAMLVRMDDPGTDVIGVRLLGEMSRIERERGRPAEAAQRAREYLAGVRRLYGEGGANLVPALEQLARLERDQGRFAEALDLHAQSLELLSPRAGEPPSSAYLVILNNIANTRVLAQQFDAAVDSARHMVTLAEQIYAPDHVNLATFRLTLAEALIGQGDADAALVELQRADAILAVGDNLALPGVLRSHGLALAAESLLMLGRVEEARSRMQQGWPRLASLSSENAMRQRAVTTRGKLGLVD